MKRLLLIVVGLTLCASVAFGQAGGIGLFVDQPTYISCEYYDLAMGLAPVYVVHKYTPGATAVQFMLQNGGGFNCIYTGESSPMPTIIGNAYAGISIGYGACLPSDLLILTVNFFCQGISPTCSYIEVVPDPSAPTGTIEVVDCSFIKHIGTGGRIYFNPDDTCHCPNPVKESSWGKVKSLYR